jgi:hypothetical protein
MLLKRNLSYLLTLLLLSLITVPIAAQDTPGRAGQVPAPPADAPANSGTVVELRANVVDSDDVPGIRAGDEFSVEFQAVDIHDTGAGERPAFAAYVDVDFSGNLELVSTPTFDGDYTYLQLPSGGIGNANSTTLLEDVGATSGSFTPGGISGTTVFTLNFRALGPGPYQISTQTADDVFSQVVVYGLDTDQRDNVQHVSLTLDDEGDVIIRDFDVFPDNVAKDNGQISLSYVVENQSGVNATQRTGELYLSNDADCNANDELIETVTIAAVNADKSISVTGNATLPQASLNANLETDTANVDVVCLILPNASTAQGLDAGQATPFSNSDDITYFPWDTDSDDAVLPVDAVDAIKNLGTSNTIHDYNGNGIVTPTEVTQLLLRLGQQRNTDVDEPEPGNSLDAAAATDAVPVAERGQSIPQANVRLEIVDLNGVAGIVPGESFNLNVYMQDSSTQSAVYSGFVDLNFDPAFVRADAVRYGVGYDMLQSATIDNASGIVDELGASSASLSAPSESLVAIVRMTALQQGSSTISTDAPESRAAQTVTLGAAVDIRNAVQQGALTLSISTPTPLPTLPVPAERGSNAPDSSAVQPVNPVATPTALPSVPLGGR